MKRSFRAVDVVAILLAICALIASWVVFERPYGTVGAIAAGLAPFVALFVALGVVFAAVFARKPLRPANYPRIEHLRIAGKYQAAGRFGETGISPLHLRQ
jgi:hypothetical protein